MLTVTLYFRDHCPDCDQALEDLQSLQEVIPHTLSSVNLDHDPDLLEKVGQNLPLVEIGPYHLRPPFTRQDLQILLGAARDRINKMDPREQAEYQKRLERGHTLTSSDRIGGFISNYYLALVNIFLLIFVALPILAPVLLEHGQSLPATIIYKIYSPLCHQLAFRSWFLYGEQAYYPRALAGIPNVLTYEAVTGSNQVDLIQARNFEGTPIVGYKVAFCERDIAIYASLLLFGLIFWISGRRIKAVPFYIWLIVGLVPIGLDGFSQLPSLAYGMPAWVPLRESTPFLRTLTGGLFGWMTAWYLFPMIEKSSRETRQVLKRKFAVIERDASRES